MHIPTMQPDPITYPLNRETDDTGQIPITRIANDETGRAQIALSDGLWRSVGQPPSVMVKARPYRYKGPRTLPTDHVYRAEKISEENVVRSTV